MTESLQLVKSYRPMANTFGDEELRQLRSREDAALTAVVSDHAEALYAAARGLGLATADAEDLVQDTLTVFLAGVERFRGESSLRTYLFGILYNKARQKWSSGWREQATDPVDRAFESRFDAAGVLRTLKGPEEAALARELSDALGECSSGLSQAQRAAFHLKEVERQSTDSICKILGVSETNLGVLLFRARNKLRECLEKKWLSGR
jgi:RNA polymerase sigma-70 factor, ECF subfamily